MLGAASLGLAGLLALAGCTGDGTDEAERETELQSAVTGACTAPIDAGPASTPPPPSSTSRPPAASLSLPTSVETKQEDPFFKIFRPTDLKATGLPLPIVVWANGGCVRGSITWEPLFQRWASAGFFVLALDTGPGAGMLAMTNKKQHRALIDWAFKQNEQPNSPYHGALDTTRIVAAGNSCGGVTALQVTAEDPRVAAVFVLSGSSALNAANAKVMGAIKVPVGYIVGGKEDIAGANANKDYDIMVDGVPGIIVSRSSGDHTMVSSNKAVLRQEARISLDWIDLALYGTPEAAATLASPTVCTDCERGIWSVKSKNLDRLLHSTTPNKRSP